MVDKIRKTIAFNPTLDKILDDMARRNHRSFTAQVEFLLMTHPQIQDQVAQEVEEIWNKLTQK